MNEDREMREREERQRRSIQDEEEKRLVYYDQMRRLERLNCCTYELIIL